MKIIFIVYSVVCYLDINSPRIDVHICFSLSLMYLFFFISSGCWKWPNRGHRSCSSSTVTTSLNTTSKFLSLWHDSNCTFTSTTAATATNTMFEHWAPPGCSFVYFGYHPTWTFDRITNLYAVSGVLTANVPGGNVGHAQARYSNVYNLVPGIQITNRLNTLQRFRIKTHTLQCLLRMCILKYLVIMLKCMVR